MAPYRPFGRTLTRPTNPALHVAVRGPYTGHDRATAADTGLNLIYMNARYYMPGTGRFLSADTLIPDPADGQAFNRYAYVLGNPIRFTDPTGHLSTDEIKKYFGFQDYDQAVAAWGRELAYLLWDTSLGFGSVFTYDGHSAMLVLFETGQDTDTYRGGFWGLDGASRGKPVYDYELKRSADVDFNPPATDWWKGNYDYLPRRTGSDGRNNYDPVVYRDVPFWGTLGVGGTIIGTGATLVLAFGCLSTPVGWVACMAGGPGIVAAGGTAVSALAVAVDPPKSSSYPLLRQPTVQGNAPARAGFRMPAGAYKNTPLLQ